MDKIHIRISTELKQRIKQYAKNNGISVSALIRMAVVKFMEEN